MNIALILSGGTGIRLGLNIPKQYIEVNGKPIISYCIESLSAHGQIDVIHIVAESDWQDQIKMWLASFGLGKKLHGFSNPGKNRQLSILHGLSMTQQDPFFLPDRSQTAWMRRKDMTV